MVLVYMFCYLAVTFGLFNLIVAVFVENTMQAAKHDEKRRKQLRMMQQLDMARKLQRLVAHFCSAQAQTRQSGGQVIQVAPRFSMFRRKQNSHGPVEVKVANLDQEITREMFESAFAEPEMDVLLADLDISLDDPMNIFDAIDADGGGTIDVGELIKGLMKVLGGAENLQNDMVASLLSIRATQRCLRDFDARSRKEFSTVFDAHKRLERRIEHCASQAEAAHMLAKQTAHEFARKGVVRTCLGDIAPQRHGNRVEL